MIVTHCSNQTGDICCDIEHLSLAIESVITTSGQPVFRTECLGGTEISWLWTNLSSLFFSQ